MVIDNSIGFGSLEFMLSQRGLLNRLSFLLLTLATVAVPFVHLAASQLYPQVLPMNDVLLYGYWLQLMDSGEPLFGIQQEFVYPYPALIPMLLAKIIGGQSGILLGWTILVAVLNLLATLILVNWGRGDAPAFAAAWGWVAFLLLLGPAGIGRIDAIAAAVAVFGLVAFAKQRHGLAMLAFTFGAWIKVWPIALAISAFMAEAKKRILSIVAISTSLVILIFAYAFGGNLNVVSFVFTQGSRGIQIESPLAMFWIWAAKFGVPNTGIYYDREIITNQVFGPWVNEISYLSTIALFVAILITAGLALGAHRAGADRNQIFALATFTAVLDLIVFNKVGSPQFMAWLALPLIALIYFQISRNWIAISSIFLIAGLTNLVYPVLYIDLMGLGDLSVALLTVRNLLLVALLVYANYRLGGLAKAKRQATP